MANKKSAVNVESASNDAFGELEQLRLIVFGQAKAELETKIELLQEKLSADISDMSKQFSNNMNDLHQNMDTQFKAISAAIADVDSSREADKAALDDADSLLSSQLEMAENAGKDDADQIHKRIDEEVSKLETTVDTSMQNILEQLERVTNDLTSSKTDRKTLAQLLATMANNLDADN
jgi:acetyl-CoA carboxylase alpha subunit